MLLIWLINAVFQIADFALGILLSALVICFLARLILPENKYVILAGKYLDLILKPIASWLGERFPRISELGFDTSPFALWAILLVARWLLQIIRGIIL